MVDNSQGHSAYPADALLVSRMNLNPGGSQALLRDGCYICNGQQITQSMVFPFNHPVFPNVTKGIKQVLNEQGLWEAGLHLECKKPKCPIDAAAA